MSVLALLLLTAGFLVGCGGQSEDGSQGGSGGNQQGGSNGDSNEPAKETRIGVGNVVSVNTDRRRMVMRTSQEAEGDDRLIFKIRKNAEITLGGERVEVGDVTQGQQAQVEYVVVNDVNRATSVQLFETGG